MQTCRDHNVSCFLSGANSRYVLVPAATHIRALLQMLCNLSVMFGFFLQNFTNFDHIVVIDVSITNADENIHAVQL